MDKIREWAEKVTASVESVFLGKREVVEKLLVGLLCRGHVLLEDVPGLGKTILARALARTMGGVFTRIQCTPDLLPADILGVSVYNPNDASFSFREGPIMSNIVLVDEINRATPRTQAALLEAMAEGQVSVEGKRMELPDPFFLIATENPIEFEGTFPLPEAQRDRFFLALAIGYPDRSTEARIVENQRRISHPITDVGQVVDISELKTLQKLIFEVYVHQDILDYMMDLVHATRDNPAVKIGASPRATLALYKSSQALAGLRGRDYVVPEDVKEMVLPVLVQRVIVKAEYQVKGTTTEKVIQEIVDRTNVPIIKEE